MKNKLFNPLSAGILMLFFISSTGTAQEGAANKDDIASRGGIYQIPASQLYGEYDENKTAADKRYKGKVLEVVGYVDKIGRDKKDKTYMTILGDGYVVNVKCFFSEEHSGVVAQLRRGERIIVRGKCDGLMNSVILSECLIQ
jgi:hypothetical protein